MYPAIRIAEYIIDKCTRDGLPISDLQLQKILYYIQLNFIRSFGVRAFNDDIVAKPYGPLVPSVYDVYKSFGASAICLEYDGICGLYDGQQKAVADWVIEACRDLNPWVLVEKSHNKNGPWYKIYNSLGTDTVIPIELIEEYARQ